MLLRQQQPRLQNALRPICRLPTEILSSIFQVMVPLMDLQSWPQPEPRKTECFTDNSVIDSYEAWIAAINATCCRFRQVLRTSPRCWTFVSLSHRNILRPHVLEARLSKSQGCLFDLSLDISQMDFQHPEFPEFLEVLKTHLARCRSLAYRFDEDSKPDFFDDISKTISPLNMRLVMASNMG